MAISGTLTAIGRLAQAAVSTVQDVASRQTNPLSEDAVKQTKPVLQSEIVQAIKDAPVTAEVAVVEVKSPWFSKINWTAGIGWLATVLTAWLVPHLTDWGMPGAIISFVSVATVTQALTWLFNTFFRNTVISSSLPKV